MKSRKQLSTPELTNEVISQLSRRFSPKALAIKMSIEKLIEKEYLERDAKDRKLLRYLVGPAIAKLHNVSLLTRVLFCRHNVVVHRFKISGDTQESGRAFARPAMLLVHD